MDLHPTPFPTKYQPVKSRYNKNTSKTAPKSTQGGPKEPKTNRVFGTTRNPNVPTKPRVPQKPSKSPNTTQPLTDAAANPVIVKPRKKSVSFIEKEEPRTPVGELVKPRLSGSTPFHSAEKCSKCRFDRLETSSYWLTQIKLAETVGRHSVSASFFRLALQCKAEPFRNILLELKRYLRRHKQLSQEEKEWKEVCFGYGILKNEDTSKNEAEELECSTTEKEESKAELDKGENELLL